MKKLNTNKITREELLNINEDDLMFITNPGRMGDEDGSTFIVRNGNKLIAYRVEGWMYPNKDTIALSEFLDHFPKWQDAWKNGENKDYKGKYTFLYMGFGNGLSIDNSIYSEFKPFLDKRVEEYLEKEKDKESLKYAAIFNVWKLAFLDMINNKNKNHSIVVVGTMFFNDLRLLIDKPRKRPTYQMIGGRVEDNETPLEAAIRECHEELGDKAIFDNNLIELVMEFDEIATSDGKTPIHFYVFKYNGVLEGELTTSDEIESFKWYQSSDGEEILSNTLKNEVVPYCLEKKLIK